MNITLRTRELPDGNESIYLDYYDNGKRYYEYLCLYIVPGRGADVKRLNQATREKANEILAQRILAGQRPEQALSADNEGGEWFAIDWLKMYAERISKDIENSDSLIFQTKRVVEIVEMALKSIRKSHIQMEVFDEKVCAKVIDFMQNKFETKGHNGNNRLSIGALKTYIRRLTTILNHAVREDVLEFNPIHRLDIELNDDSPEYPVYLTKDELHRFMETPTQLTESKRAFVFSCLTGLRMSDIYNLKWSHIKNFETAPAIVLVQQKTKVSVSIPLSTKALEWLPLKPDTTVDTHVFYLPTADALRTGVQRHAKKAGIEKDICFHTARHTFATMLIAAGVELATVSRLMGHTTIKTTQIYADVLDSTKIEAVNRFNGLFG